MAAEDEGTGGVDPLITDSVVDLNKFPKPWTPIPSLSDRKRSVYCCVTDAGPYAITCFELGTETPDNIPYKNLILFLRSVATSLDFRHPVVDPLDGWSIRMTVPSEDHRTCLEYITVTKFVDRRPLSECFSDPMFQRSSIAPRLVLYGVARGLWKLHRKKLCHRDIQPSTILVDDDFHPCLINIGLPSYSRGKRVTGGCDRYLAPEIFGQAPRVPMQIDQYSFGVLLYELLAKSEAKFSRNQTPSCLPSTPDLEPFRDLLGRLLSSDPK